MSIGQALAAARESAGLTVDDVSRITKVRGQLIRQIEKDEFGACGGAVYARGHIRNIAAAVGLDPAPLVAEFDRAQRATAGPDMHHPMEHEELVRPPGGGPNWTAAMFVASAVLFVVAMVAVFNGGSPDGDPLAGPTRFGSQSPVATPKPPKPTKPAKATEPPVAHTGVNVRVRVTGESCWVRVRDARNDTELFEGVLRQGQVRHFKAAQKLSLEFGNAGAVRLVVNGRDVGAPGSPGAVVRVTFGPGDPAAG
jgi:cytoskeleton protein RodZ